MQLKGAYIACISPASRGFRTYIDVSLGDELLYSLVEVVVYLFRYSQLRTRRNVPIIRLKSSSNSMNVSLI